MRARLEYKFLNDYVMHGRMTLDGRTLSHEMSEKIRRMAVQRVREGEKPSVVIKSFGLSRTCIYPWIRVARTQGKACAHWPRASTPEGGPRSPLSTRCGVAGGSPARTHDNMDSISDFGHEKSCPRSFRRNWA